MRTPHLFVALLIAAPLAADIVTLKNGDRITGKIIKKDGAKLTLKGDLTGDVTIPWDSVTSVTSDTPLTVVLPGDQAVLGPVTTSGDRIEVAAPTGKLEAPLKEVAAIRDAGEQSKYERFLNPGVLDLWAGYFDLGFSLARGNARTNTFTTAFNASRVTLTDKTSAYFNQLYSTATIDGVSAASADAIRGGWAYNKDVSPRFFFSFFNDYEFDRFQNLDLRFVAGGGAGYTAIKTERSRLDLPLGFAYNREQFNTPLTRHSGELYYGDEYTYKMNSTTSIRQAFRIFHSLTDVGVYRINFDLGSSTTIKKFLSWQVTASDRFLSNPVIGRKRNDILLTTGFRINFAR